MLIYKRVERLADQDDLILDLGAKSGSNLNTDAEVVAIDLEFSEVTNKNKISYLYADGRNLPFEDDVFDFVVVNQVIEHTNRRKELFQEVARVLNSGGIALFSFPNRFTLNKPHGLPRAASVIPKPLGLYLSERFLDKAKHQYYRNALFPLSPVGARLALRESFGSIQYITIAESMRNREIYSDRLLPQLFVAFLPLIAFVSRFTVFRFLFELVWGHVAYECRQ